MKLAILYAMEREASGLLEKAGATALPTQAGMGLYALEGDRVLCVGGVGKVNAAMAAQLLLDRFGVQAILNAGCAGCLTDLPVGTVVVADHCVQHDVDTSLAGDPPGFVSTVERTRFPCKVLDLPGAVTATVATGDWFARDFARAEDIRRRWGAVVCDMEAAAAAQVCLRAGVPFAAVKVVSDHLFDRDQGREYRQNFAAAMAALDEAVLEASRIWEE